LGIGDWGLGIGDWAQSPIPNPQSPIPNPHFTFNHFILLVIKLNIFIFELKKYQKELLVLYNKLVISFFHYVESFRFK
jgi:hypothetical protein